MIDKDKLIANWGKLKDETKAQILALADKAIKEKYFVPKDGEEYYFWDMSFVANEIIAHCETYDNTAFDNFNLAVGNCFRTEEEAIFAGNCDYFTKRFETYVNRHSKKLDWNDKRQSKFYTYNEFQKKHIYYYFATLYNQQGTTYASSEQILRDAINDIGEDNFLKYVMKVEA